MILATIKDDFSKKKFYSLIPLEKYFHFFLRINLILFLCKKNIKMKQQNRFYRYLFHIIFWMIVCIIFSQYSYLRPNCYTSTYKEVLCALIIAVGVYLNKFILFPKIYLKGRYLRFWFINTFLVLLLGFTELQILEADIFQVYGHQISPKEYSTYLVYVFILVSLRDAAFLAFFFIIGVNQNMKSLLIQRQLLLATINEQIIITTSANDETIVNVKDIVYISCKRNITTVHLSNGKLLKQYQSLAYMERILPKNSWLKVNRSTIIMYAYVCEYNENEVTIKINNHSKKLTIPFQRTNQIEIFDNLKKNTQDDKKRPNGEQEKGRKSKKWRSKEDNSGEVNEFAKQVLETIRENPSIFASEIKKKLIHLSERSIDRHLKYLKNIGLIQYKGSPKKGGYYIV